MNINTCGIDDTKEDFHHNRYEPTPYEILERIVASGYISKENLLIDYGCGKGRVALYLNKVVGCSAIGIDYNQLLLILRIIIKEI